MAEIDPENKSKIVHAQEGAPMPSGVTATGEPVMCIYPGCDREAVPGPKPAGPGRTGPPPRYCDNEEHNAARAFQELKRLESEGAAAGE